MSTAFAAEREMAARVAVIGAGVVGSAVALALARRGVDVALLEAESEPGLAASGTNSGILHTGFDSVPGDLETRLILRAAALRDPVFEALGVPVMRCGAEMRPLNAGQRGDVAALAENAAGNGVEASLSDEGVLSIPGEAVTDPVRFTLALAAAAARHGAELRTGFEVVGIEAEPEGVRITAADGSALAGALAINCAGLGAGRVAKLARDDSFEIYPRKGEFFVFEQPRGAHLDRILLPVPTKWSKGVLVFPTVDDKVIAGPTAVDLEDPDDWSVRPAARGEVMAKAVALYPPLAGAEPVFAYAGLRPAGRHANYVIERSPACERLVNVAAIRSTGLTASLGIAEHAVALAVDAGLTLRPEVELRPGDPPTASTPWWRRTAEHRAVAGATR